MRFIFDLYLCGISLIKKSVSMHIEDLTSSLILLLQPNTEIIEEYLNKLKQRVKNTKESTVLSRLITKENYANNQVALSLDLALIKLRDILLHIKT